MKRRLFTVLLGSTILAPVATEAQGRPARVGFLILDPDETPDMLAGPLAALGYGPGRLVLDSRSAEGDPAKLAALAADLVRARPDVLVAGLGTLAPKALAAATDSIPIVFTSVGDPVGAGLVQGLARPGGNVTGLSAQGADFKSKQLQLLLAVKPGQTAVGVLSNPDTPYAALALKALGAAAAQAGVRLVPAEMRKPADFGPATLDAMVAAGAQSLLIVEDPLAASLRARIAEQAMRCRLPTITGMLQNAAAGTLLVYGSSDNDRFRQAAAYVDRLLKGARAADLPVEQPTRFKLIVNLRVAKAIGIEVPPTLLAQADEVIE